MYAVEMKGIVKTFPGVVANDHVDLSVEKRTIHCLLGENGSGKTTLMNVLFGLHRMDEGKIFLNGEPAEIANPADAERLGIGMVHQHFMLIPQLTVLENIILGSEPCRLVLNRAKVRAEVQRLIETYHFYLDVDRKVAELSVGMMQRVEILKLLYRKADVIIFDEPTAVLTPQEVGELFGIFRRLVAGGCTVIFITHKLNEIFEVSDRVSVLRKGRMVGTTDTRDIDAARLSEMMVGRRIEETVGVAGIDGNGQMELEELITGVRRLHGGEIRLCGRDARKLSVRARRELGLAYIPSDRMRSGAMGQASVKENFLLGHQEEARFRSHGFVNQAALRSDCERLRDEFEIKLVSVEQSFSGLSGGNQQKVILAREVSTSAPFVLAAQPIRGLDIGAIDYVHRTLLRLRGEGKGILLISAELSELLAVSDRILVLCGGAITAELARGEFDENRIGLAMSGETGEASGARGGGAV